MSSNCPFTTRDQFALEAMGHATALGLNGSAINAYAVADEFIRIDGAKLADEDRAIILRGIIASGVGS